MRAEEEEAGADRDGARLAVQRALRVAAIGVSVGAYSLLAPPGYMALASLCWFWRREPLRRARRVQRITGLGYRFMLAWMRWLRVLDFDHRRALPPLPSEPCIVVANHPTQLDVPALGACLGGACTIVKSRIYRRRMLAPLMVGGGFLEGPADDPISVGRVIADGVQRLRDGMRLFVFPEGSRSPPGGLRPFGRVAFEIAIQARVPLVCVGIRCQPVWLSREVPLFRPPLGMPKLRLTLLAIEPPAQPGSDSRALRAQVEQRYRRWLDCDGAREAPGNGSGPEPVPER